MCQQINTFEKAVKRYLEDEKKVASRAQVASMFAQDRNSLDLASRTVLALGGAGGDVNPLKSVGYTSRNIHLAEFEKDIFEGLNKALGRTINISYGCVSETAFNLACEGNQGDLSLDLTSQMCKPSLDLIEKVVQTEFLTIGSRFELTFLASRDPWFKALCLAQYPIDIPQDWLASWKKDAMSDHLRIVRKRLIRLFLNRFGRAQGIRFRMLHDAADPRLNYFNQTNPGKPGGSSMSTVLFEVY